MTVDAGLASVVISYAFENKLCQTTFKKEEVIIIIIIIIIIIPLILS